MQKFLTITVLFMASTALADPVDGLWKTAPQDDGSYGFIKVAPCGDKICGTLLKGVNAAGEVATTGGNIGKQIIWDMVANGDGSYGGGKIWAPDRDKTYDSEMILENAALRVRGCILGICRDGGLWTRVD
jgi:uncharacterized protein (DUF2147 family)